MAKTERRSFAIAKLPQKLTAFREVMVLTAVSALALLSQVTAHGHNRQNCSLPVIRNTFVREIILIIVKHVLGRQEQYTAGVLLGPNASTGSHRTQLQFRVRHGP